MPYWAQPRLRALLWNSVPPSKCSAFGKPDIGHSLATLSLRSQSIFGATVVARHGDTVLNFGGTNEITKPRTQRLVTSVAKVR